MSLDDFINIAQHTEHKTITPLFLEYERIRETVCIEREVAIEYLREKYIPNHVANYDKIEPSENWLYNLRKSGF